MLRLITQSLAHNRDLVTRSIHRAAAVGSATAAEPVRAPAGAESAARVAPAVDRYEPPRPAMTSQVLGVSLLDMATPASCAAARAIRMHRARLAAQDSASKA